MGCICMFALERQKRIMELLASEGAVSVSRLSVDLSVTEETVRRDLEKLEKQGSLKRTHGGAVPADENNTYEASLEKRKATNIEAKQKIAKLAVKEVFPTHNHFFGQKLLIKQGDFNSCRSIFNKKLINCHPVSNLYSLDLGYHTGFNANGCVKIALGNRFYVSPVKISSWIRAQKGTDCIDAL